TRLVDLLAQVLEADDHLGFELAAEAQRAAHATQQTAHFIGDGPLDNRAFGDFLQPDTSGAFAERDTIDVGILVVKPLVPRGDFDDLLTRPVDGLTPARTGAGNFRGQENHACAVGDLAGIVADVANVFPHHLRR